MKVTGAGPETMDQVLESGSFSASLMVPARGIVATLAERRRQVIWTSAAVIAKPFVVARGGEHDAPTDPDAGIWRGRQVARRFVSPDGMVVLVGKAAEDNDVLMATLTVLLPRQQPTPDSPTQVRPRCHPRG